MFTQEPKKSLANVPTEFVVHELRVVHKGRQRWVNMCASSGFRGGGGDGGQRWALIWTLFMFEIHLRHMKAYCCVLATGLYIQCGLNYCIHLHSIIAEKSIAIVLHECLANYPNLINYSRPIVSYEKVTRVAHQNPSNCRRIRDHQSS